MFESASYVKSSYYPLLEKQEKSSSLSPETIKKVRESTVTFGIVKNNYFYCAASGFVIPGNRIITNAHVVAALSEQRSPIAIRLSSAQFISVKCTYIDPLRDIALFAPLEECQLPPPLGFATTQPQGGDSVHMFGGALLHDEDMEGIVVPGEVIAGEAESSKRLPKEEDSDLQYFGLLISTGVQDRKEACDQECREARSLMIMETLSA